MAWRYALLIDPVPAEDPASAEDPVPADQLSTADRVLTGQSRCEFDQSVNVAAVPNQKGWFIVEYKGKYLAGAPDAQHKSDVGELWEASSGGKALFLMATRETGAPTLIDQIANKIAAPRPAP